MRVDYDGNKIVFSHNAEPFSMYNLNSLVQQVSGKSSTNNDEAVTGKFGTGFIATHLLSPIIQVSGPILFNDTQIVKRVNVELDRSGESSEELMEKIGFALDRISRKDDPEVFAPFENINRLNDPSYLGTSFTYPLTSDGAVRAAEDGLADVAATLPVALIGNASLIEKVVINDRGQETVYTVSSPEQKGCGINLATIVITQNGCQPNAQSFYYTKGAFGEKDLGISLYAPFADGAAKNLVAKPTTTPFLYRDFPLIGSETFNFPFIINGKNLNPTEDRADIVIHSEEDKEAKKNRRQIEQAFELARKFTLGLIDLDVSDRFKLAFTRLPKTLAATKKEKHRWDSRTWYEALQEQHRAFLFDLPLVRCADSKYRALRNILLPKFGAKDEVKKAFYDLAAQFLGHDTVPAKEELLDWHEMLGPESENNWPETVDFDLKDLFVEVQKEKNLLQLSQSLGGEDSAVAWVKDLLAFAHEHNETALLKEYAVLPNIYGRFKKQVVGQLFKQDEQDILTDFFLDRLKEVYSQNVINWRTSIIDRRFTELPFLESTRSLTDLSQELNDKLKPILSTTGSFNYKFLKRGDEGRQFVFQLLKAKTTNQSEDSFRFKLLTHLNRLYGEENHRIEVENINSFKFEIALKLAICFANRDIQRATNINGLAEKMGADDAEAMQWLNAYYKLLQGPGGYADEINRGKIVPDLYGDFHKWDDLEDPGTDDARLPEELIDVLAELNPRKDWRGDLMSYEVEVRRNNARSFAQLSEELAAEVRAVQDDLANGNTNILNEKATPLSTLIDWCVANAPLAEKHLSSFKQNRVSLSFALTVGNTNIRIQDIRLLGEEGTIEILQTIDKSGLKNEQVQELLATVNANNFASIIKQAKGIKAEADHKAKMLQMGQDIEKVIQEALNTNAPGLTASRPNQGKGNHDILVTNSLTGKTCRIEVKSYASHKGQYLRFAPSQADAAVQNSDDFIISMIPIQDYTKEVSQEYIAVNLFSCHQVGDLFETGMEDYRTHQIIRKRGGVSTLYLDLLGEERIEVSGDELRKRSVDLAELVTHLRKTTSVTF